MPDVERLPAMELPKPESLALRWLALEEAARLLVTDTLILLWANGAARCAFDAATDLALREGVLSTTQRSAQSSLMRFVEDCDESVSTLCLPCENGSGHLLLRGRRLGSDADNSYVGISFHRSIDFAARFADVETGFQLTRSEDKVLQKMLEGMTADEIAADIRLSIETIRSHIRNIYVKVGVTSREGLFARLRAFRI
jgi:DNA-binding CsgD family transcriptional regulator